MVVGSIPTVGVSHTIKKKKKICVSFFAALHPVGFEPTHPKILRPERSALDRSAKSASYLTLTFRVICGLTVNEGEYHLL